MRKPRLEDEIRSNYGDIMALMELADEYYDHPEARRVCMTMIDVIQTYNRLLEINDEELLRLWREP